MNEYSNKHIKCFNPSTDEKDFESKKIIYHYTSPQGLYEILGNTTIRFTDCQFLNDKSEYTHIKKPLLKAFEEVKKDIQSDFETSIMDIFNENFESEDIKITKKNSKLTFDLSTKRYYVFCASLAQDSLGMWNYYVKGGNYQGYNIGFNIGQLLDCFSTIKNTNIDIFYGKVIYRKKEQINLLKDLLLKADKDLENRLINSTNEEDLNIIDQEVKGEVLNYIENYRLFFKDEAFINEKEYRFILKLPLKYIPNNNDPISMKFVIKNGIVTPICELSISKEKIIDSIMLSPMIESELADQGLKRYLIHNGYDNEITIRQSKVPIRF